MVTAREIVAEAEGRGVRFEIVGERLRATPRSAIDAALYDAIGAHKAEVVRELRRRGDIQIAPPSPAEAAKLLRERRWPATVPVCDFLIGRAGEACKRCGASWIEHYAPGENAKRLGDTAS